MKWFKHLSGSLKDPMIADLITEFGGDGYMVFFGLLDMMSEDFDTTNPGTCTFSVKYLTRNLQLSRHKFVKILKFLEKYPKKNGKIFHVIDGDKITITCDRLKDLCDEWTKRTLGSNSRVTREQLRTIEVEVDKEVEKEKETALKENIIKEKMLASDAKNVLAYLNEKCNRNFKRIDEITARLKEGASCEDCKRVIDIKNQDPYFIDNPQYMNPLTLFKKSNFEKYINQRPEDFKKKNKKEPGSMDVLREWYFERIPNAEIIDEEVRND